MTELSLPPRTSASQLVAWTMCPRKYAFSYVYVIEPEFRSTSLVLGSALHGAVGWWFEERIAGREPSLDDAKRVLAADLAAEGTDNVRWKDSSPEALESRGIELLETYLSAYGSLPVVAVEKPFEIDIVDRETGEVLPRTLKGYFDLVLEDRTIVELKTSSRAWREGDLERHLQAGAYVSAWNTQHGGPSEVVFHVIVKTKTPRVDVHRIHRGEPDERWWFHAVRDIERSIASGVFPPTPGPLCHECEFARTCGTWPRDELVAPRRRLPVVERDIALSL